MSYKIHYDIDLDKALAKIPKRDAKFIKEKIESLANHPRPSGSIKLSGKELYRIRHGIYRIIYSFHFKAAFLDDVKAPRLSDRKRPCIINTRPFAIAQPRGFDIV